jgi:thioredoxin-dependent peroxiredoxin
MKFNFTMKSLKFIAPAAAAIGITVAYAGELKEGSALPTVTAMDQSGTKVNLAEFGAKGFLLVYFYPKADTPGCTKQACSLRDAYAKIGDLGVKVIGVSMDSIDSQKAFAEKYKLPFTLLADQEAKVADAFEVPHLAGFAKRQAFLFKDGKLIWRDLNASTEQQANDVIRIVESHK